MKKLLILLGFFPIICLAQVSYEVSPDEKTAIETKVVTKTIDLDAIKTEILKLQDELKTLVIKKLPDKDTLIFYNAWIQKDIDRINYQITVLQSKLDTIIK